MKVGLALLASLLCGASAVEQWGQWEKTWKGPSLGNPFIDVEFKVVLTPPTSAAPVKVSPITVRGFYDGEGQFKARFMPPVIGTWHFETQSNVPALDRQHGNFAVQPPSSTSGKGANHGPVIAKPNSTKFWYADGTPFFAVATTVYGMFLNASNTLKTLRDAPFNKVRTLLIGPGGPYEPLNGTAGDPTRFNPKFWHHVEDVLESMMRIGVQAEVILFGNGPPYPASLACLGGADPKTYNMTLDTLYLRYTVARLASFRNIWWSMANEWNQYACKWEHARDPSPCPGQRDFSDPGCGVGGSNSPAHDTVIWDKLFQTVHGEDPSSHLLSIHNNGYLYNYSQPWVSHFSIQHTHNKPKDLWKLHGRKPFMYDEIKYEGRLRDNWGSLSAPQMVQRFWWAAGIGAYGMHGEMLYKCPYWSDNSGYYCGESVPKIAWFKGYMENTTLHPPFEECEGDDDGYVHTLTCGTDFIMFHFYNGHPNASSAFQYIYLPKGMKNRQDLLQPWEMIYTLIYKPEPCSSGQCPDVAPASPPPPGTPIFGPARDPDFWEPVGIGVDEDTLPHILTFTNCDYKNACERDDYANEEGFSDKVIEALNYGRPVAAFSQRQATMEALV